MSGTVRRNWSLAVVIPLAAAALASSPRAARAHEPISADAAVTLVEEATGLHAALAKAKDSAKADAEQADAACGLGVKMELIVQILNRDLAAHGGDQGMSAQVLINQLKRQGVALSFWPEARRYRAYLAPLETCVAVAGDDPRGRDALYRLVRGRFYDSFVYNPLEPVGLDWPGLRRRIANAERLLATRPGPAEREEAAFILAVNYVRASRMAPNADATESYGDRARTALGDFVGAYPDSIRSQAAQVLVGAIPTSN